MQYLRRTSDTARPGLQRPNLPAFIDGALERFYFSHDDNECCSWLFTIMLELESELQPLCASRQGRYRESILRAWRDQRLVGVRLRKTDNLCQLLHEHEAMQEGGSMDEERHSGSTLLAHYFMFAKHWGAHQFVLPCFIVTSSHNRTLPHSTGSDSAMLERIWVAPRVRRLGLGRALCVLYPHEYVHAAPDTITFWHSIGYTERAMPPCLRTAGAQPATAMPRAADNTPAAPAPNTPCAAGARPGASGPGAPPGSGTLSERALLVYKKCYNDASNVFRQPWNTDITRNVIAALLTRAARPNMVLMPVDGERIVSTTNAMLVPEASRKHLRKTWRMFGAAAYRTRAQSMRDRIMSYNMSESALFGLSPVRHA